MVLELVTSSMKRLSLYSFHSFTLSLQACLIFDVVVVVVIDGHQKSVLESLRFGENTLQARLPRFIPGFWNFLSGSLLLEEF